MTSCNIDSTVLSENYTPTVQISYMNSVVMTSSPTILSGNLAKVTLSLEDTHFNPYIVTNVTVTFQNSGGTSTGIFSSVTNNYDGTYSANFLGVKAGTPTLIQAFVNGNEIQSSAPTLQVLSGNYSLSQSTLSWSSLTDIVGLPVTATLTVKDSVGNPGSTGLTVVFSHSGGSSTGSFGATTDHGDGTYSAVFTGISAGSATSLHASIQGNPITSFFPVVTVIDSIPSNLTYSSNPAIFTKGVPVTDSPSNGGGPINSYSISPSLPAGLSLDGGTGVISGTPTVLQTATTYTVTGTNTGGSATTTLSMTINDRSPSALSYSVNPTTYTKGSAISNNVPSNSGGSITNWSISPSLPAGLNFSVMTGIISGTPTAVSGTTTYTVTGTNSGGSTTASLSLTVIDIAPSNLTYTTSNAVYTKGTAISSNSPTNSGGPIVSYSISPSLPSGLSFNTTTGVMTGTPTTVSSATLYTVTATNSGGSITGSVNITVQDVAPSSLTYANNPVTFTKGQAATDSPSNSGGAVTSYSVSPALPSGLSLNTSTGVVSGTPSVFQTSTSYTITATNSGGFTTASLSITINDVAPSALTYSTNPAVYTKSSAITANTSANSGGSVVSYGISPSLPTGLNFNTSTGAISGTPSVISGTTSYTVTATNTGGSTTTTLSITVNDIPPSTLTYSTNPATYTLNQAIAANTTSNSGGVITSYSVSPALPAGLSLNTSTGSVTGTPTTITSTTTYTVTGVSSGGNVTASLIITINDVAPSALTYAQTSPVYTKNSAITADTVTHSGGPIVSYSISPSLPNGLSLNTSTGTISGTPTTVTVSANYTVTALNTGGSTTAILTIVVNDIAPSALTYSTASPVYTKGLAITNDTPTSSGGSVVSYGVSPALPTGLALNTSTGVISGTATVISATATYTVTATNSGGSSTASLSITVNDVIPSNLVYSGDPVIYTQGTSISSNTPTSSGGAVVSYSVSPALPAGLTFNTTTGLITGTPTAVTATANYTVTATNSGGSVTDAVSITIKDVAPSSFTYSSNPATYFKGTSITNNAPTLSGGAVTGYSVSPALPAGLSLNTSTGVISGTPTAVTAVASYTVTALNSGGSTTVSVSITVNDIAPNALTYTAASPTYVKGTAITSDIPSNSGGTITSYAISPALPTGLSMSSTTGVLSGTPSAVSATTTYTVTATNSGGSTTASLSITVNDVSPSVLTYSANPAVYTKSSAISSNAPSNSGGTIAGYSVSPSLPTGLSLNTSTGVITGTPTVVTATASYTVTATNSGGSTTVSISITVNDVAPSALSYSVNPATYTNGYAMTNNTASYSGGSILSFTVSPALPAGLSLSVITGTISGTPTAVAATQTYVVTGTNSGGSTTANVSITVGNPTIAVSANNNQTAAARSTLPSAFVAIVKDASGTLIANQLVDWAVTAGGGSLTSAQNATTAGGLSSSKMTLGASAGSNTCTATIDGTAIAVTFTATATTSSFTQTWTLSSGAPFTYNSSKIDFTNGYGELTPASQTDNSNSCSIGFGDGVTASCGGSSTGTAFSTATDGLGSSNYMMLSQAGTATDLELDSTWTPAWSNIVGYWKLNDSVSSTTALDSGPLGTKTGTVNTGVTLGSAGVLHTAAIFNGSGSANITAGSANLPFGNTSRSVSLWINPTSLPPSGNYSCMMGYGTTATNGGQFFCLYNSGGTAQIAYGGINNDFTLNYTVPTSTWTHLAFTFTGTTASIYVNGNLLGSSNRAGWNTASSGIALGNTSWTGYPYTGALDDVAIWNTALSSSAIAAIYQHESSKYAGTFTSRVMDGLNSTNWTTIAPTTTLPFFKELPDTATSPSPSPVSESQSSYFSLSATQPLMQGLIGLWHLDEASGTTATNSVRDTSGNNNNGTPSSGVVFGVPGELGTSASFSANTINIGTGMNSTINASTTITTSAWVYQTSFADYERYVTRGAASCSSPYVNLFLGTWNAGSGGGGNRNPRFALNLSGSLVQTPVTNYVLPLNQWFHIVGQYNGSQISVYINGVLISSTPASGSISSVTNPFAIGGELNGCAASIMAGNIDEVGIWSRALSSAEILELYRRGANRIRYQVRSCPDSTCSTSPTWLGPDGSNQTYFSELNNNSIPKDGGDLSTSDSVSASSPTFTFNNFVTASPSPTPFSVPTNRYFQYRAIMESDDTSTSCNYGGSYTATWCSPELRSVAVSPNHYDTSAPTIVNKTGVNFATLTSLLETLGTSGCSSGTLYNLSPDNTNWYYLSGSTWALAGGTVATATPASSITPSALSTFPSSGTVYFKTFLQSSGTSACTINSLAIGGTQ